VFLGDRICECSRIDADKRYASDKHVARVCDVGVYALQRATVEQRNRLPPNDESVTGDADSRSAWGSYRGSKHFH
jgi:hypothetical protein